MGGVSCLRRHSADGDHTHALVAAQSHYFSDNLVALLGPIRAWNYSTENASSGGAYLFVMERRRSKCWTRPAGSLTYPSRRGAPVAALIVLPQPKKAGSSDAPEPLSSDEVAATMALNSVRISG